MEDALRSGDAGDRERLRLKAVKKELDRRNRAEELADRDDAPDFDGELTFGDGNIVGKEDDKWIDGIVDPLVRAKVREERKQQRAKRLPQLPLPIAKTYQQHYDRWCDCQMCDLGKQRSQIVLARGDLPCDVLYCAEAPGISEDANGTPLCGPSGQLLDYVDAEGFKEWPTLRRAFCNLVGCYPREAKTAGVNEPDGVEIEACAERLREFVTLARPRLVVLVGGLAQRWWPRVVPEHFWSCRIAKLLHPGALLKPNVTEIQKHIRTQHMIADVAQAVESLVEASRTAGVV